MKIKISNILDLSKFLETRSGQELKELLEYLGQLSDELVTALTSNLSYSDNFSCEVKEVEIRNGLETIVVPQNKKAIVKEIRIRRIYDDEFYIVDSMGWTYNSAGNIKLKINLAGSPLVTREFKIDLLILYG